MIRTAAQWKDVVERNPFAAEAQADPAHLVAMCLADRPAALAVNALRRAIVGRERIELLDATLYIVYPAGIGTSRLTNAIIERTLGTAGTARNWNTVLKIAAAIEQRD